MSAYIIREADVPAYSPANHSGTSNRRLVGEGALPSSRLEVLRGSIAPGQGALPHLHPAIEQVVYVLSGQAVAEIAGETLQLGPGDCCLFPAGARHLFVAEGLAPVEVLVVYSPPYGEDPAHVVR